MPWKRDLSNRGSCGLGQRFGLSRSEGTKVGAGINYTDLSYPIQGGPRRDKGIISDKRHILINVHLIHWQLIYCRRGSLWWGISGDPPTLYPGRSLVCVVMSCLFYGPFQNCTNSNASRLFWPLVIIAGNTLLEQTRVHTESESAEEVLGQ